MGTLIVAGKEFRVDAPIVNMHEGPRWDASKSVCIDPSQPCAGGAIPFGFPPGKSRTNRFAYRPQLRRYRTSPPIEAARAVVRQFVVHHDGCPSARVCWNVLHNERGLSCHFLIDNDGTIYQTLDLAYMGFHAAGLNVNSIGVELCNRGDAKRFPNYYAGRRGPGRDVRPCKIHGHTYLAYDYTDQQYQAFRELVRGLQKIFPNLPTEFPQSTPGQQAWGQIERVTSFSGYLGHYHITRQKWDPGPFDFKAFLDGIRGVRSFPIRLSADAKPDVPRDTATLAKVTQELYRANEEESKGGFFPIGPFGSSRLWHGGIHLSTPRGAPVYAPFPGRVVAVRVGSTSAVGSTNFVLMRHDMTLGPSSLRFFTLFYHLEDEFGREGEEGAPRWLSGDSWKQNKKRGFVALLDEPLEAGDVIGRAGEAGPAGEREPQIHLEVFSAQEVMRKIGATSYTVIDGTASGRFVDDRVILEALDNDPRDGVVSRRELMSFYRQGTDRSLARFYTTLHVSEWTDSPSWEQSLKLAPDFKNVKASELEALVADQIQPGLWWNDRVAEHAKLPRDGVVYHYHPITFLKTINEKLIEAEIEASSQKGPSIEDAEEKPDEIKGDIDDIGGDSFVTQEELELGEDYGSDLTLEDLAQGYSGQ